MFTTTAVVSTIGTLSLPAGARVVLRCRVNEWLINARRVLGSVGWLPAGVRCSCMAPTLPSHLAGNVGRMHFDHGDLFASSLVAGDVHLPRRAQHHGLHQS